MSIENRIDNILNLKNADILRHNEPLMKLEDQSSPEVKLLEDNFGYKTRDTGAVVDFTVKKGPGKNEKTGPIGEAKISPELTFGVKVLRDGSIKVYLTPQSAAHLGRPQNYIIFNGELTESDLKRFRLFLRREYLKEHEPPDPGALTAFK